MIVSGVSGNATFDQQKRFPFMFNGHSLKLDYTKTFYELKLQQTSGGTISGSPVSGESGTTFDLSATPDLHYHLETYSANGAALTGNSGTYTNSDVTAKGIFAEDPRYGLTLQQSTGGTLIGSPTSGYSGDLFGLTATPSSHYSFNSYSVTGTTLTGNSGMFNGTNVTAKANWTEDPRYTLTVQQSTGGTLASNKTSGYTNDTFTLTPTPSSKYSFSAYQVTGTTMTGNNGKFNTSNVTAKAVWEYHPATVTAYVASSDPNFSARVHRLACYDSSAEYIKAGSAFAYGTDRYWGYFYIGSAPHLYHGLQYQRKSKHDNSTVVPYYIYPCLANIMRSTSSREYLSAAPYDEMNSYYKLMITKSAYFAKDSYVISSNSSISAEYREQPYGFSLSDSAFISNFSASYPFYASTAHKVSRYRVNINGEVGAWQTHNTADPYLWVNVTSNKLVNPLIEIEFSAETTGRVDVTPTTSAKKISNYSSAWYPSWTGNMCYLE